jgi:YHS domain-containing protein
MVVANDEIAVDFEGVHYAFCSEQCRERFQMNPRLYIGYPGSKAPKQKGEIVRKTRRLKLGEALPRDLADKVHESLHAMMGIDLVEIDGDTLYVTYDLLQATEAQIERELTRLGIPLDADWKERLRRSFARILEDNEIDSREVAPPGHHH